MLLLIKFTVSTSWLSYPEYDGEPGLTCPPDRGVAKERNSGSANSKESFRITCLHRLERDIHTSAFVRERTFANRCCSKTNDRGRNWGDTEAQALFLSNLTARMIDRNTEEEIQCQRKLLGTNPTIKE